MARFYLGDFVSAENHFARGRAFVEAPDFLQTGGRAVVVVVTTFAHGSFNAWITGHADAARERQEHMRRILEGAQRNPHVTDIAQIAAAIFTPWSENSHGRRLSRGKRSLPVKNTVFRRWGLGLLWVWLERSEGVGQNFEE
jgi:hypothetical protein